jgi:hypothetical protein
MTSAVNESRLEAANVTARFAASAGDAKTPRFPWQN